MKRIHSRIAVGALASALLLIFATFLYLRLFAHLSFHVSSRSNPVFDQHASPQAKLADDDFSFHTLDGAEKRLSASKGQVVFVNRWGTWCSPCVAEMPSIQKLYARYKDDPEVTFLLLASRDSPEDVRKFAARHNLQMPLYVTTDQDISGINFSTFPSTFLYGKNGHLVFHKTGGADWADPKVVAQIEALKRE